MFVREARGNSHRVNLQQSRIKLLVDILSEPLAHFNDVYHWTVLVCLHCQQLYMGANAESVIWMLLDWLSHSERIRTVCEE
jgi:hypothetical protein